MGSVRGLRVSRRSASRSFFASLPGLTRQSMRKEGELRTTEELSTLDFSMDHRVKPGGDEAELGVAF